SQENLININDHINYTSALNKVEDYSKSLEYLQKLYKTKPQNIDVLYYLAKTFSLRNNHSKAIKKWEELLKKKTFNLVEEDYLEIANNYRETQNYIASKEILQKGIKKYNSSEKIAKKLIDVTILLQDWKEAF